MNSHSTQSAISNSADSAGHREPEQRAEPASRAAATAARARIAGNLAEKVHELARSAQQRRRLQH